MTSLVPSAKKIQCVKAVYEWNIYCVHTYKNVHTIYVLNTCVLSALVRTNWPKIAQFIMLKHNILFYTNITTVFTRYKCLYQICYIFSLSPFVLEYNIINVFFYTRKFPVYSLIMKRLHFILEEFSTCFTEHVVFLVEDLSNANVHHIARLQKNMSIKLKTKRMTGLYFIILI